MSAAINFIVSDDDPDDFVFIEEALKDAIRDCNVIRARDGEELMAYLTETRGRDVISNTVVLLDLNMPKKDGRQALKEIKGHPELKKLPVIILTTSSAEEDVELTYRLGANAFAVKPTGLSAFQTTVKQLAHHWARAATLPRIDLPR